MFTCRLFQSAGRTFYVKLAFVVFVHCGVKFCFGSFVVRNVVVHFVETASLSAYLFPAVLLFKFRIATVNELYSICIASVKRFLLYNEKIFSDRQGGLFFTLLFSQSRLKSVDALL